MAKPLDEKLSMKSQNLRRKLWVISALILILPFSIFLYVMHANGLLLEQASYSNAFAIFLAFLIVLAVLAILHEIFGQVVAIADAMKRLSAGAPSSLEIPQSTKELKEISQSFNKILERFEQGRELEHHAGGLRAIKELVDIASKSLDINIVMHALLEKAMEASTATIGSIFLIDPKTACFNIVVSKGLAIDEKTGKGIPIHESLARFVISNKSYLLVSDIEADARFEKGNDAKYDSPSFLCMPIKIGDKIIGILNLSAKPHGAIFDANDIPIISLMIEEIRYALENARLHSDIKEHSTRLEQQTIELSLEIGRRKQVEKQLDKMAHIDQLTQLPNRALFMDRLAQAMAQARRNKQQLAVLFMDLDKFKIINDTLGHEAGDKALKEVAGRLQGCMREMDTVARLGGDEFITVLIDIQHNKDAAVVAQKVLDVLSQPIVIKGNKYNIGVSIGISIYPTDGEDVDTIISKADTAMYQAKESGNAYQFHGDASA